jgi:DNA-binding NarL/FixJ family response regulator
MRGPTPRALFEDDMISEEIWKKINAREFGSPLTNHMRRREHRMTTEQRAKLEQLVREGLTVRAAAAKLGINRNTAQSTVKARDLRPAVRR